MAAGKNLVPGSAQMLLLRLLAGKDMYGYQMIRKELYGAQRYIRAEGGDAVSHSACAGGGRQH